MDTPTPGKTPPRWQPISAIDRRVLGVLVEKAKTTPDAYPMSVNAIATGANQKNNRYPLTQLEVDDVQESLDRLRELGAIAEVQGGGRVPRFRHYMYDWLGVDKVELAVMAELLLRGAQTEGELRGRAARMEPIADLNALRVVLDSLKTKQLVIPLTPEGRGHVITHNLYQPRELEKLRAEHVATGLSSANDSPDEVESPVRTTPAQVASVSSSAPAAAPRALVPDDALAGLRSEISALRRELDELRQEFQTTQSEFRELRNQLG
jgi:uncharacterized protein YceH (UPF0502 family)